ncbi:MAG: DUF2924 domain-containing protein [Porphyrobacter sp.]|nr:DUF2924 domain-containing protein [Porphyrobacter sp.]
MRDDDNAQVLARLAALKAMSVRELKADWAKLFGTEAPNNSRPFLEQRLAYRIQELTFGGLSKPARQLLDALADEVEGKKVRKSVISDPRNPVIGTRLVREWNGVEHVITVLRDGFDWQGRRYKTLSAIARKITGTQWNGYRFFGLRPTRGSAA